MKVMVNWTQTRTKFVTARTHSEKSAVFEVVFDNDVRDGVEDEGNVICVSGTCEVSVDFLCVLALV